MCKNCPVWIAVSIGVLAAALSLSIGLVWFTHLAADLRHALITGRGVAGSVAATDVVVKFCESLVARADWTVATAQLLLAVIAVGATAFAVKQHVTEREIKADAKEALAEVNALRDASERRLNDLIERGKTDLGQIRTEAADLAQTVQTRLDLMDKAREEYPRMVEEAVQAAGVTVAGRDQTLFLARIAIASGELDLGVRLLEQVAETDERDGRTEANVLNQLSGLLDHRGQYDRADRWTDAVIKANPKDVIAHFHKAIIQNHLGSQVDQDDVKRARWECALASFEEARRLHMEENMPLAPVGFGKLWLFAGETAEYMAEVDPAKRDELLARAAVWYSEGTALLAASERSASAAEREAAAFWRSNGEQRLGKLQIKTSFEFVAATRQRPDIPRLGNGRPLWPMGQGGVSRVEKEGQGGNRG